MSVSDSINDLLILVNELIDNIGAKNVADGMENQGWVRPIDSKIEEVVRQYFEVEVFEDEFDQIMEEVYAEFYNIAAQFDYEIKTTY